MKTIKDSVHDHIEVSGVALDLLDTPPVQRLRNIAQLGTVGLVYPSANHTRFEHSLGVYHLAKRALAHLGIGGRTARHVEAAALLHDIGHTPYSHNVEPLVERRTGRPHEAVDDLLSTSAIADVLDDHGLEAGRIEALIAGEGPYGGLVSGELDVDRLDYLVRDAHHTGVPYGTIDHGRLVREFAVVEGRLVLAEGNIQTAESVLLARALMNPVVYNHHVARISKTMLRRGVDRLISSGHAAAADLRRMDDHDLRVELRSRPETEEVARRLDHRDLLKRAVWIGRAALPENVLTADHATVRSLEDDIAAAADVGSDAVLVDRPPEPTMAESSARVLDGGEVHRLDERSALVDALRTAQREQWRLGVYTRRDLTDRVGAAAASVLDLDADRGLVSTRRGRLVQLDEFAGGDP